MHLKPGTIIEGNDYVYTIVRTLGQGKHGITYLAQSRLKSDPNAGLRTMALKEYFLNGVNGRQNCMVTCEGNAELFEKDRAAFIEEARNLSNFDSAGIVRIYEAFDANNTSYFSMEHIAGGDLEEFIMKNGPLPAATIKSFARQLALALRSMHRKNVLHLDVKPSNVMMRDDEQLVLIDFGFSKQFDEERKDPASTQVCTPRDPYKPIEQDTYKRSFSQELPATLDVYALAATIYKMTTGREPLEQDVFEDQFPYDLLDSVDASSDLVVMLQKGLAHRKRRIQTMDEFLALIEELPEDEDNRKPAGAGSGGADNGNNGGNGGDAQNANAEATGAGGGFGHAGGTGKSGNDVFAGNKPQPKKNFPWATVIIALAFAVSGIVGYTLAQRHKANRTSAKAETVENSQPHGTANYVENLDFSLGGITFNYSGETDPEYPTNPIPHGHGTGIYETGAYIGEYRHGLRHGQGTFDYDFDGVKNHFSGTFSNDMYSEGILKLQDGMWYKGTFLDGQPCTGTWYDSNNKPYLKIKNGK